MAIDKVIIGNTPYYKATYEKDFLLSVVSALKVLKLEPFLLQADIFQAAYQMQL